MQRNNSTIKPKPPKEPVCNICKNAEILKGFKGTREKKQPISWDKLLVNKEVKKPKNNGRKKRTNIPWKEKGLNAMIQHVQKFCNAYIRARDMDMYGKCISCNSSITQAGHRYSVGDYPGMRFLVNNIHGQEISCNHFKSGNVDAFDRGLNGRHGEKYTHDLKQDSLRYIRYGHNWHRFDVIEIGETYKYLHKNKIWIFTQKEFNHFRSKAIKE
jgi:hypothetical protein